MSSKELKGTEPENPGSEEEISFEGVTGIRRAYDFLPYTPARIKRILKEHFQCELENIWQGYKANRRPGYHEIYKVVDIKTGKVIVSPVSLDGLRQFLARKDFPLYDEKSTGKRIELDNEVILLGDNPRNPDAERFMKLLNSMEKENEKNEKEKNRGRF